MNAINPSAARIGDSRLGERLRRETAGEVLWTAGDRGRYATDASIYQVEPVGVLIPRTIADVEAAMAICREEGVPVLPRGGGTSQCGQTVNRALVIDCTKYLRDVVVVDPDARTARVQPGIALGALNDALKKHGLFFPVDPSTWARCTIGGMAGNNSCGSKSIRYGLMADNVLGIDALLADGSRFRFGELPDNLGGDVPAGIADLIQRLRALGAREAEEIAARFPEQLRRVGGYNLDALTPAARAAGRGNLARLLVGSEGTLAFSAAIDLKLWPVKPRKALGICQFPTFRAAMAASQHLVTLDPEAVELVDRTMIDLGRSIPIFRATIDAIVRGEPDSLLIVEFHGQEDAPLARRLDALEEMMGDLGYPGAVVRCIDPGFQAAVAEVREAGLNIMMSMKGDGKPVSFIEDCAVALPDLADYTERLNQVFERHGTKGTWYAHASVGCLHVRPVLNMKDPGDVRRMREIAEECFALVREYKGSHSGEHGDGIVRSEFNEPMFGPRIARAFEAVKDAFDPAGLLNPGRVVRPPRMDDRALFRYHPDYHADATVTPALDWSAWPGPQGGLLGAVEMCNNNGTCRKFDAGVMCPSFRATRDEQHLTRGRANTLRLALTGQLGPDALASEEVHAALSLCVSCKGCRRECPTGVDMAKMKIEAMAARARTRGVTAKDRLIATLPRWAPFAGMAPFLANARDRVPGLAALSERLLGLAAGRSLPRFRHDAFHDAELPAPDGREGEVILFPDVFNRHFEPENLRAAARVLTAAGYRVAVARPPKGARPLDDGRTLLAAGLVEEARAEAKRTLDALSAFASPVIGIEPSSLLTLRDEFPALLPGEAARALVDRALLLSEFLAREKPRLALKPIAAPAAHIHGHCHQKSFGAFPAAVAMLSLVPDLKVTPITSSCCGMAGSFGYEAEHLEVSKAMAELSLLPAVRAAPAEHLIVADGTSCRHQIADLSGRTALHSVRVLEMALA
ncbi:FAD-binding and (Fe-S)-binding domain-containing protein [Paracraurococcus lichenis]|uniref:FAD-linked oxidase C-terminal domain-containing protein n=1 Tax=Paracraurococcus lichenis TaxID=3064888 RepID=A0ABT9DWZ1_9PROT|nr:FAD-binding oxidoreductase [Paracraurococcus sp. LOR1-02]MDO9708419.1 FAD-linked oxidase C-terminal domain-containing protein [Paracraurococcus sp. LOR1-02]